MTSREKQPRHSEQGTTRSPADRDIFHDDGPKVPVKDLPPEEKDKLGESSEAGGVD
jgi:hypothetical protein